MRTARRGQLTITDETLLAPAARRSRACAGRWAILLLALAALLGGCASGGAGHVMPRASATPAATPYAPADLQPVSMAQAWGTPAIRTLTTDLGDNRPFSFSGAITPDGQWLVGMSMPRAVIPGQESSTPTGPSYAVLYNTSTRQVVTMHQLLHIQSSIQAASADDHW